MEITAESIQDQIPYYLSQEAKDNLVKALKRFPDNINYYINLYQSDMLQGDGWTSLLNDLHTIPLKSKWLKSKWQTFTV